MTKPLIKLGKRASLMNVPQGDRHLTSRQDVQKVLKRIKSGMPMTLISTKKLTGMLKQAYDAGLFNGFNGRKHVAFANSPLCKQILEELKS